MSYKDKRKTQFIKFFFLVALCLSCIPLFGKQEDLGSTSSLVLVVYPDYTVYFPLENGSISFADVENVWESTDKKYLFDAWREAAGLSPDVRMNSYTLDGRVTTDLEEISSSMVATAHEPEQYRAYLDLSGSFRDYLNGDGERVLLLSLIKTIYSAMIPPRGTTLNITIDGEPVVTGQNDYSGDLSEEDWYALLT